MRAGARLQGRPGDHGAAGEVVPAERIRVIGQVRARTLAGLAAALVVALVPVPSTLDARRAWADEARPPATAPEAAPGVVGVDSLPLSPNDAPAVIRDETTPAAADGNPRRAESADPGEPLEPLWGAPARSGSSAGAGKRHVFAKCTRPEGVALLVSPLEPAPGDTLRVLAVSQKPIDAVLIVGDQEGERVARNGARRGGPPYWWSAELATGAPGRFRVKLETPDGEGACVFFDVQTRSEPEGPQSPSAIFWPVERQWDRNVENLYSAWVEKLFDAPLDVQPSWHSLHEVTRDAGRNVLHDYLGLGEDDEGGLRLEPDCADLPFFLRGYFAWKLRLPFGYSTCFSVAAGQPPTCTTRHTNLDAAPRGTELQAMQRFFSREVAWTVHSATGRTAADDEDGDMYPTTLSPTGLRPGTVYADPYGHVLVVARRVEQTPYASGMLLAVDAQPDHTVARKQYWRGNFLFAIDPALGGAGFKHFRPIVSSDGGLRALTNEEIVVDPQYGDYSFEQYAAGVDGFYDRVEEVLSPEPRDVDQVFGDLIEALDQQVRTRVLSVANGEEYKATHSAVIAMPEEADVFQTEGPWEDYSTPSRDLRLLIAIDVVRGFPAQVSKRPDRYRLRASLGKAIERLESMLAEETARRTFEYTRSDGSPWTLRLADVIERQAELEMAYNPNDCIEVRWGAPEGSDEMSTCRRHAPAEQRRRMEQLRHWFHDRNRPST